MRTLKQPQTQEEAEVRSQDHLACCCQHPAVWRNTEAIHNINRLNICVSPFVNKHFG